MASAITTLGLVNKVKAFVTPQDTTDTTLDSIIQEAIVMADRELREVDEFYPLAWDIVRFDGVRTVPYSDISAVTQADPGVFTAQSCDSDITGHGFHDHSSTMRDIVLIDGIDGTEELNKRFYLLQYINATTFSLKTLDGLDDVDTSALTAYSSGGQVYHAGFVLNTTLMLANVATQWTVKRVVDCPTFDGYPSEEISQAQINENPAWTDAGSACRPFRWRYWQMMATASSFTHYLFWYPVANDAYNVAIPYQKEVPDISTFSAAVYPFHPYEVHAAIWHGALAHIAGQADMIPVNVAFAQKWINEWAKDKLMVRGLSRKMLGIGSGGFSLSA